MSRPKPSKVVHRQNNERNPPSPFGPNRLVRLGISVEVTRTGRGGHRDHYGVVQPAHRGYVKGLEYRNFQSGEWHFTIQPIGQALKLSMDTMPARMKLYRVYVDTTYPVTPEELEAAYITLDSCRLE